MDADAIRHSRQSAAACSLSAAARGRETAEGRADCRQAQTAGRDLQRCAPPVTIRCISCSSTRHGCGGRRGSLSGSRPDRAMNLTVGTVHTVATQPSTTIHRSTTKGFSIQQTASLTTSPTLSHRNGVAPGFLDNSLGFFDEVATDEKCVCRSMGSPEARALCPTAAVGASRWH
jgi:hypothetical protein